MKTIYKIIVSSALVIILYSIFYIPNSVRAFEATSTSFELHAGDVQSISGAGASGGFQLQSAGGQTAIATSTSATHSFASGILYWLFGWLNARYEQSHFRWREDTTGCTEPSTDPACWIVAQDTQYNPFQKEVVKRLRFEVVNKGWTRGSAPSFTLETAELQTGATDCAAGPFVGAGYAALPTDYSGAMRIATSTIGIGDGIATTNVGDVNIPPTVGLHDEGATWVAGQVKTTGNTTASITLNSNYYTEVEYGVMATPLATNGAAYCFRLNDNLVPTRMVYNIYAKAQLQSGLPATGTLQSAVFDTFNGGGVGKGAAFNSVLWKGSQNGSLGKVQFQFASSENSTGPWTFIGGPACNVNDYYDTTGQGVPTELTCSPLNHNNHRYFRYKVRLCSAADCVSSGLYSPIVTDVVVNWAP